MTVCEEVQKGNVTDGLMDIHHSDLSWHPVEKNKQKECNKSSICLAFYKQMVIESV